MTAIAERVGRIWTPQDDIDLLAVSIDSEDTSESAIQAMIAINQAARDWLDNKISTSDYCDILEYNGVSNPFEIVGEFCEHTELIILKGL